MSNDAENKFADYYASLLIAQYHDKPKAKQLMRMIAKGLYSNNIFKEIEGILDIDKAVGKQLDIIGKIVGVDRKLKGLEISPNTPLHSYSTGNTPLDYTTNFVSYSFGDTLISGRFLMDEDIASSGFLLSDDDFKTLIRLKIVLNNSNFSEQELDEILFAFFENDVQYTSSVGEMYYFISPNEITAFKAARQKNLLPKPAGVQVGFIAKNTTPFFAYWSGNKPPPNVDAHALFCSYSHGNEVKHGKFLNDNDLI